MTEREYLVSLGLAKPGRGRYSADAKAALEKARQDGKTFDEPSYRVIQMQSKSRKPRVEVKTSNETVTKPKPKPQGVGVIELQPRSVSEGTKFVHTSASGKKQTISDSNVCGNCGVSLGWHKCSNPTALVRGHLGFVPVQMI